MKRKLSESSSSLSRSRGEGEEEIERESEVVELNVGGESISTRRETLVNSVGNFPNSLLAKMFSPEREESLTYDKKGRVFIDADLENFRPILNVLRRPTAIEQIPPHMSLLTWCTELDYWGLANKSDLDESAKMIKPLEAMSMKEIAEKLRRDIGHDEDSVIRILLEATGYAEQIGKSRKPELHIPLQVYKLPWGDDLGQTLALNAIHYQDLIRKQLVVTDVLVKPETRKKITYTFQGTDYTVPETKTVTVSFTIPY